MTTLLLLTDLLDQLVQTDTSVLLAINGAHSRFFDVAVPLLTERLVWVPLYLSLLFVLFRNMSFKTAMLCLVCIAVAVGVTDYLSSNVLRFAVARMRPSNLNNEIHDLVHVVNGYRGGRYGFPSSHAANTFCLAMFLVYLFRFRVLSFFMIFWSLLNCYTRLYLGVHYPGDILVGLLLGASVASLFYLIFCGVSRYKTGRSVKFTLIPVWVGLATIACVLAYACVVCLYQGSFV